MFVDPRTVAAAGITALLLLSAGCGGGERGTEDAPERTAVQAAKSVRFEGARWAAGGPDA